MAHILVRNLHGTNDNNVPAGYSSWLDFWVAKRGINPDHCRRCSGHTSNLDGAHVQKVYGDNSWYIVPLCRSCNLTEGYFNVPEEDLIPVR